MQTRLDSGGSRKRRGNFSGLDMANRDRIGILIEL
jgi:hypothetical protein